MHRRRAGRARRARRGCNGRGADRRPRVAADAPPRPLEEEARRQDDGRCPDHGKQPRQPVRQGRQMDVSRRRWFVEQPVGCESGHDARRGEARAEALSGRRHTDLQVVRAAVLLVLDPQLVHAGGDGDRPPDRVHVVGRRAPDDQLVVEPDIEPIVAGAGQLDRSRFGHVPEAAPADAEETAWQPWMRRQEVQIHCARPVGHQRRTTERRAGVHPPVEAREHRRVPAEDEQEDGRQDGQRQAARDEHSHGTRRPSRSRKTGEPRPRCSVRQRAGSSMSAPTTCYRAT